MISTHYVKGTETPFRVWCNVTHKFGASEFNFNVMCG